MKYSFVAWWFTTLFWINSCMRYCLNMFWFINFCEALHRREMNPFVSKSHPMTKAIETVFEIEKECILSPNSFPWITVTYLLGLVQKPVCWCAVVCVPLFAMTKVITWRWLPEGGGTPVCNNLHILNLSCFCVLVRQHCCARAGLRQTHSAEVLLFWCCKLIIGNLLFLLVIKYKLHLS